ncbi:hypothetical protein OPS25_10900 [Alteromonas ponticola]|uniref:Uncharacterized protein n=1 Tax=Alteromonas aquimaris TaxID=2998417 RepID=A0ABT3P8A4_9ALTE|nr:hypothetical protein [Alteromonas aquimaris]MCW8109002.1 hypothetical protein [Alteromonas aquimaris]
MLTKIQGYLETHPRAKLFLLLLAVLLASPIAMELLIFLQYGGIEVAFLCMVATFKPYLAKLSAYRQYLINLNKTIVKVVVEHQVTQPRAFLFNSTMSLIIIFVTGSITMSLIGWLISLTLLR